MLLANDIDGFVAQPTQAEATEGRVYDLLIRDDPHLDTVIVDESTHAQTIQQLLFVSVLGSLLYGGAVGMAAQFFHAQGEFGQWLGNLPLLTIPLALTGALLLAQVVCLPSFYFYTQLTGLDASFRLVTAQALRVQARSAMWLLGVLPIYAAVVLAAVAGFIEGSEVLILLGLALPFIVGIVGISSLYRSFARLSMVLPTTRERRCGFLLRMVLAWSVVYSAVCPVALYRIGEALAKWL